MMIWLVFSLLILEPVDPQEEMTRLLSEGQYAQARQRAKQLLTASADAAIEDRASLWQWLGTAENLLGQHAEAQRACEEGLKLVEGQQSADPEIRISLLVSLADAQTAGGHFPEAGHALRRALDLGTKELPPHHQRMASVYDGLALLHLAQGHQSSAENATRRSLAILEKKFGPDHVNVAVASSSLAAQLIAAGRPGAGLPLIERSQRILLAAYGPDHPETVRATYQLAMAQVTSAPAVAEKLLRGLLLAWIEHPPNTIGFLTALAETRLLQGDVNEAIVLNARALDLLRNLWGPEHVRVVALMDGQARLLKVAKRGKESAALRKEADRIRQLHGYAEPNRHTVDIRALRGR